MHTKIEFLHKNETCDFFNIFTDFYNKIILFLQISQES
jgi:hypothetical protein